MLRGVYNFAPSEKSAPAIVFAHGFGSVHGGEKSVALESECARRGWAFRILSAASDNGISCARSFFAR